MDKKIGMLSVVATLLIGLMAVSVAAVPVTIDWLKIDGDTVEDGDLLDVDRNAGIDIKIQFEPDADVENMYIEAFISGYEHGVIRDDRLEIRDVDAGKKYKAAMHLDLPQNMDKDEYTLRLLMHGRTDILSEWRFDLDVGAPRHALVIKDVIFEPEYRVKTGRSLIANARVANIGEKDEEGVKVSISIPELGISDSEFIDELEADDSVTSEAMHVRIDDCVEPGEYKVLVKAEFADGDLEPAVYESTITVADGNVCEVVPAEEVEEEAEEAAPVEEVKKDSSLVTALEVGLIVLIVLLVVLALVVGFNKMRDNGEDEDEEEQTYY